MKPLEKILPYLFMVKQSKGKERLKALAALDKCVTSLFPPVEGAPLPSSELEGKDVLPGYEVPEFFNNPNSGAAKIIYL